MVVSYPLVYRTIMCHLMITCRLRKKIRTDPRMHASTDILRRANMCMLIVHMLACCIQLQASLAAPNSKHIPAATWWQEDQAEYDRIHFECTAW